MAIVITTIGLLGLAAMQATGLKNNNSAYHRSQATVLAYDIADRMRANTISINNYLTSSMALGDAAAQAGCKHLGGCSTDRMAENDLYEWNSDLQAALPSATGTITLAVNIYTISVNWDENLDGDLGNDDPVLVSFQP